VRSSVLDITADLVEDLVVAGDLVEDLVVAGDLVEDLVVAGEVAAMSKVSRRRWQTPTLLLIQTQIPPRPRCLDYRTG
jgi:hypothetical protein